jgi:hypothetical protein
VGYNLAPSVKEVTVIEMFGNRALKSMFGDKRDDVTGGWRKLFDEGLHNF